LLGVFLKLSQELFFDPAPDSRIKGIDVALLALQLESRRGWLTHVAIDLTALGSPVVLGIVVAGLVRPRPSLALLFTGIVVSAVALSRVYLGVHYSSNAAAGTSLGLAWAFLSAAALSWLEGRRSARSDPRSAHTRERDS
jgi:hypothetical protein